MPRTLLLSALLGLFSTLFALPAHAQTTRSTASWSSGADVSYPQCSSSLPSASFGIVGITGGRVFLPNSCAATEVSWAAATGRGGVYMNTADPGPASTEWSNPTTNAANFPNYTVVPPATGYRPCDPSQDTTYNCDWDYGWNAAQYAFEQFTAAGHSAGVPTTTLARMRWWLDVETANSWSVGAVSWNAQAADATAVQGMLAGLAQAESRYASSVGLNPPPATGIYTSAYSWTTLMGKATFPNPDWIPGASSQRSAQSNCSLRSPAGGETMLTQWVSGVDYDWPCTVPDQTY